jgi:hypothetical protein
VLPARVRELTNDRVAQLLIFGSSETIGGVTEQVATHRREGETTLVMTRELAGMDPRSTVGTLVVLTLAGVLFAFTLPGDPA